MFDVLLNSLFSANSFFVNFDAYFWTQKWTVLWVNTATCNITSFTVFQVRNWPSEGRNDRFSFSLLSERTIATHTSLTVRELYVLRSKVKAQMFVGLEILNNK
jgi:hypothetical protein